MAKRDRKAVRSRGNTAISSRDDKGIEHRLVVIDHPGGLVSISDDEVIRILSQVEAIKLIRQLAEAIGVAAGPGPFSSRF